MTMLGRRDPEGVAEVVLVCDGCGQALRASTREFQPVWQAAVRLGWDGSERAVGPHLCTSCVQEGATHPPRTAAYQPFPIAAQCLN